MKPQDLISEAIALPVEERALVVDSILRTLNPPEPEIDQKWAVEARKRLHELKTGHVNPVPGDQVFERIWKKRLQPRWE